MISRGVCSLRTQDSDFVRRVRAFLRSLVEIRLVEEAERLHPVLQQNDPAVLLLDLRIRESRKLLEQVQLEWPDVLIIAFGIPRSDPFREAGTGRNLCHRGDKFGAPEFPGPNRTRLSISVLEDNRPCEPSFQRARDDKSRDSTCS